jgi:hypothetical protein
MVEKLHAIAPARNVYRSLIFMLIMIVAVNLWAAAFYHSTHGVGVLDTAGGANVLDNRSFLFGSALNLVKELLDAVPQAGESRQMPCEVHVIQRAASLMNQQLDGLSSALLEIAMEALGVQVHCNTLTSSVIGEKQVIGLRFTDGSELACDMLVISAGIKPNTDLAVRCGLTVEYGEEDSVIHNPVPRVPLAKQELVQTIGERGLQLASRVSATLIGEQAVAANTDDMHRPGKMRPATRQSGHPIGHPGSPGHD